MWEEVGSDSTRGGMEVHNSIRYSRRHRAVLILFVLQGSATVLTVPLQSNLSSMQIALMVCMWLNGKYHSVLHRYLMSYRK